MCKQNFILKRMFWSFLLPTEKRLFWIRGLEIISALLLFLLKTIINNYSDGNIENLILLNDLNI